MTVTPFVCHMIETRADIDRAITALTNNLDSKQFEIAGVELGRLLELGKRLSMVCRLAQCALREQSDSHSRSRESAQKT